MRVLRPAEFAQMLAAQEDIGPGAYFFRDRKTGERFGPKDLQPGAGRHDEPAPSCQLLLRDGRTGSTARDRRPHEGPRT